ncbi:MAG: hypothetical protein ACTSRP_26240, partial [Candidatus Helarchaeota archaeon]
MDIENGSFGFYTGTFLRKYPPLFFVFLYEIMQFINIDGFTAYLILNSLIILVPLSLYYLAKQLFPDNKKVHALIMLFSLIFQGYQFFIIYYEIADSTNYISNFLILLEIHSKIRLDFYKQVLSTNVLDYVFFFINLGLIYESIIKKRSPLLNGIIFGFLITTIIYAHNPLFSFVIVVVLIIILLSSKSKLKNGIIFIGFMSFFLISAELLINYYYFEFQSILFNLFFNYNTSILVEYSMNLNEFFLITSIICIASGICFIILIYFLKKYLKFKTIEKFLIKFFNSKLVKLALYITSIIMIATIYYIIIYELINSVVLINDSSIFLYLTNYFFIYYFPNIIILTLIFPYLFQKVKSKNIFYILIIEIAFGCIGFLGLTFFKIFFSNTITNLMIKRILPLVSILGNFLLSYGIINWSNKYKLRIKINKIKRNVIKLFTNHKNFRSTLIKNFLIIFLIPSYLTYCYGIELIYTGNFYYTVTEYQQDSFDWIKRNTNSDDWFLTYSENSYLLLGSIANRYSFYYTKENWALNLVFNSKSPLAVMSFFQKNNIKYIYLTHYDYWMLNTEFTEENYLLYLINHLEPIYFYHDIRIYSIPEFNSVKNSTNILVKPILDYRNLTSTDNYYQSLNFDTSDGINCTDDNIILNISTGVLNITTNSTSESVIRISTFPIKILMSDTLYFRIRGSDKIRFKIRFCGSRLYYYYNNNDTFQTPEFNWKIYEHSFIKSLLNKRDIQWIEIVVKAVQN